jgi:hypothetical protein
VGEEGRAAIVLPALIRGLLLATFDPRRSRPRYLIETTLLLAWRAVKIATQWSLKEAPAIFSGLRRSSFVLGLCPETRR